MSDLAQEVSADLSLAKKISAKDKLVDPSLEYIIEVQIGSIWLHTRLTKSNGSISSAGLPVTGTVATTAPVPAVATYRSEESKIQNVSLYNTPPKPHVYHYSPDSLSAKTAKAVFLPLLFFAIHWTLVTDTGYRTKSNTSRTRSVLRMKVLQSYIKRDAFSSWMFEKVSKWVNLCLNWRLYLICSQ